MSDPDGENGSTPQWTELADGVFVRRYRELDLSVGLVLGSKRCLVVDTRGDAEQGAELAAAVRELTPLPWTVVLTHDHFDHAYGLPAFEPCEAWAHPACWAALAEAGRQSCGRHVRDRTTLELGGRRVVLAPVGAAHSGGDVVVQVPDTGILFAGDLVEHVPAHVFTEESFGPDTTLAGWAPALALLLDLAPTTVVPGHGAAAGPDLITRCREALLTLLRLRHGLSAEGLTREEAVARSPLPAEVTLAALTKPAG